MNYNISNEVNKTTISLLGTPINVGNAMDYVKIVDEAKLAAEEYEWIYHCTNKVALLNILSSRELWLSNLKYVNDKEEDKNIDLDRYKGHVFVSCFTYDKNVPDSHWHEYGSDETGIVIAFKKSWVKKVAQFMVGGRKYDERILSSFTECISYKQQQQQQGYMVNPFFIESWGFFKVIYDDNLKIKIQEPMFIDIGNLEVLGKVIIPSVAGIVKQKQGICNRYGKEPYNKNWEEEKEIRLKFIIRQLEDEPNGSEIHDGMIFPSNVFFSKIAVPLTENAFEILKIRFSPNFLGKDQFLSQIRAIYPELKICEL